MSAIDGACLMLRAALIGLALSLGGCTVLAPINAINTMTPGDTGAERVAYGEAFGPDPRQKLDVYAPAGRVENRPVLVFFYGGGWSSGHRGDYAFVADAFAARGYVVVVPDARLVPNVQFPAFLEDGARAVRWVEDNIAAYGGDPHALALMGHSSGAYTAVMLAMDGSWLNAAHVDRATVRAVIGVAGPYDFTLPPPARVSRLRAEAAFGKADIHTIQPIDFVRADAPPALLLTGDEDGRIDWHNSVRFADALSRAGADAEVKIYPGVGHVGSVLALAKPWRANAPVLSDTLAFLTSHLPQSFALAEPHS